METQTTFKANPSMNSTLMDLPILKHFNADELKSSMNSIPKGANGIFWFLKLAVIAAAGWAVWTYILPTVFLALGQFLAVVAVAVGCVLAILLARPVFKWLKVFAKFVHKKAINQDPFGELEIQRQKMIDNQTTFRASKQKISALKNDMEVEAKNSEADSNAMQTKILTLQTKCKTLKDNLDQMVATGGATARGSDEYVNGNAQLALMLSDSSRIGNKLKQSQDFVQKYGSRAAIMKKFGQKLVMVETSMDIKIADFDATIEMLKKDYEFGQKSAAATNAAKSAMMFTKGWEFDYAMDVVTSTIASDIATTAGNLKDIDSLTSQYSLDSDELYVNLNTLADNIKVGKDEAPTAKQYSNPDYQLTSDDKMKSGGFQDLM